MCIDDESWDALDDDGWEDELEDGIETEVNVPALTALVCIVLFWSAAGVFLFRWKN
jgi:hypothetical protein